MQQLELVEKKGWKILTRSKTGEKEGELSYVGPRGELIIDYPIVNEKAWKVEIKEYDRKQKKDEEKAGNYVRIIMG